MDMIEYCCLDYGYKVMSSLWVGMYRCIRKYVERGGVCEFN
jgi:hypothetical protein